MHDDHDVPSISDGPGREPHAGCANVAEVGRGRVHAWDSMV